MMFRFFSLGVVITRPLSCSQSSVRARFMSAMAAQRKGLVLGLYEGGKDSDVTLTKAGQSFEAAHTPKLTELIQVSGLAQKKGKSRVFYFPNETYSSVAVVSLGKRNAGYNELEEIQENRENVRVAVAGGVKQLQDAGVTSIDIDPCGDPEAAAEGANLCISVFDELKSEEKKKARPSLNCFTEYADDASSVTAAWMRGVSLAEGQNFARRLMESPASHMTPTRFAQEATDALEKLGCQVIVRDRQWAESQKMMGFVGVAKGSDEPLKFVEIHYKGGPEGKAPFALVGKGITFDSGGISLKPPANMDEMRADMGGGACVVGALRAAAKLKLPINVIGFVPLCENMPSGGANKPGDVFTSMNGKTVQVDNTDAEGRLILCDALCYAQTFNPSGIIDMATLTGAMAVALGSSATGVFSNNTKLWELVHKAGTITGDRMWRMPLFKHYSKQIQESQLADLNNISGARAGGACTAAAFLREFVTHDAWMHLDIAGVMSNKSEVPFLPKGMAGRPTRTIVEFLNLLSKEQ